MNVWQLGMVALCLSAASVVSGASSTGEFPMRDRVFVDVEAGVSFRYPYDLYMPDQYVGEFSRRSSEGGELAEDEKVIIGPDGKPLRLRRVDPEAKARRDVRCFSYLLSQLPGGLAAEAELSAIGDKVAGEVLAWKPCDYYRTPAERPFAAKGWAPADVVAALGEGKGLCSLVVKHGDRVSGLVLRGGLDKPADNARMIDAFEIMATGEKPSAKPVAKGKVARAMTWREAQCRKGQVIDAKGAIIKASKGKPVAWSGAWEFETEHYHLTANRDPDLLVRRSVYYEALYRAYSALYQPERLPPVKAEVHIFDTCDQFEAGARQWVEPGFTARKGGGIVGGFFTPGLLSLWVYEESGQLGGEHFSVEHVSAHECSHQFLHLACNGSQHVPTWINEGLAVYFEAGVFQNGEFVIKSPTGRIERLRAVYSDKRAPLVPLTEYLDHHGHISADQYGEVFAMTHFWLFGTCSPNRELCKHKDCGLKRFRDYWAALKKGEDGNQAFDRIFFQDMIKAQGGRQGAIDAWTKALMEYVTKKLK